MADIDEFNSRYAEEDRGYKTPCWIWKRQILQTTGYAVFGKRGLAHRWAYEHYRGKIPFGVEPDHLCRVRECANPWHLELVTHRENVLRSNGVTAINARKTHCDYGHEFTEENTIARKDGGRACRLCETRRSNKSSRSHREREPDYQRDWMRKYREANRDKTNEASRRARAKKWAAMTQAEKDEHYRKRREAYARQKLGGKIPPAE